MLEYTLALRAIRRQLARTPRRTGPLPARQQATATAPAPDTAADTARAYGLKRPAGAVCAGIALAGPLMMGRRVA